jgi:hypothetical protein
MVLLECGHGGLGQACAARIARPTEAGAKRACPVCRCAIEDVVQVRPISNAAAFRLVLPRGTWLSPRVAAWGAARRARAAVATQARGDGATVAAMSGWSNGTLVAVEVLQLAGLCANSEAKSPAEPSGTLAAVVTALARAAWRVLAPVAPARPSSSSSGSSWPESPAASGGSLPWWCSQYDVASRAGGATRGLRLGRRAAAAPTGGPTPTGASGPSMSGTDARRADDQASTGASVGRGRCLSHGGPSGSRPQPCEARAHSRTVTAHRVAHGAGLGGCDEPEAQPAGVAGGEAVAIWKHPAQATYIGDDDIVEVFEVVQ